MKKKILCFLRSPALLTYCSTFGIMLIIYILMGIYPFGENHIISIDAVSSFVPAINEYLTKITNGESLFYSWRGAMGNDYYATFIAFFINPVVLLGLLFTTAGITEVYALICITLIPCISASFAYFISKKYQYNNILVIAFSLIYGLSSYVTAYYWNFYWLPSLALLPLVAIGLDALIHEGKYRLYTITLGLSIASMYLFGIFLCYFSILYFIVEGVTKGSDAFTFKKLFTYAASSVCAGVIGLLSLIPAYVFMGISAYQNTGTSVPMVEYFFPIPQMLSASLFGMTPSILQQNATGTANIYTGVLSILLVILYWFNKEIPKRKKIALFCVLAFLLMGTTISTLGWALNVLRFPSGVPHRFMFIYTFFIAMMAFESYERVKEIKLKSLLITSGSIILFIFIAWFMFPSPETEGVLAPGFLSVKVVISNIMLILFFTLLLFIQHMVINNKFKLNKHVIPVVILITVMAELTYSTYDIMYFDRRDNKRHLYANAVQVDLFEFRNLLYEEDEFYRTEMLPSWNISDGKLFDFNSISAFANTYEAVTQFLPYLGISAGANRIEYSPIDPFLNAILGIKYTINNRYMLDFPPLYFEEVAAAGELQLYENILPLSLGFMIKDNIDIVGNDVNILETKNVFASTISGIDEPLYINRMPLSMVRNVENVSVTIGGNGYDFSFIGNIENDIAAQMFMVLDFIVEKTGPTFLTLNTSGLIGVGILINDEELFNVKSSDLNTLYLGVLEAGNTVSILSTVKNPLIETPHYVSYSDYNRKSPLSLLYMHERKTKDASTFVTGKGTAYIYQLDEDVFFDMYDVMAESLLDVWYYDSTFVHGDIYAEEDGLLFLSVPYDDRWWILTRGYDEEEWTVAQTQPVFNDAFIGIELEEGYHEIQMHYIPIGIQESLVIPYITLLGVIFLPHITKIFKRKEVL